MKGYNSLKYILLAAAVCLLFIAGCSNQPPDNTDPASLASCLAEKGAVMYGTEWCSHCQNQKKMFGDSFSKITFVDCDNEKDRCVSDGVSGYPTWKIGDKFYPGEKTLSNLAIIAVCESD